MKKKVKQQRAKAVLFALVLLASSAAAAQTFKDAEYFKTATAGEKKGGAVWGTLNFDATNKQITFQDKKGTPELSVKSDSVKHLLYERTAKPRYVQAMLIAWPLIFTKSKKHYLTVQYDDPAGSGHYAILRLDKGNYQQVLAMAESVTGKQVERTEER